MGHALSRFVDEHLDIPPSSASSSPDDDDALLTSMPPSGSDSILSSDFHGHDNNGHIRIHDDDDDDEYAAAYYRKKSAPATHTTVIQPEETRGWVDDAYVDESIGTSRMRAEGIPELEEKLTESESHTSSSTKTISLGHEHNSSSTSTTEGSTSRRIQTAKKQHSMDVEGKKGKSLDIDDEGYSTTQKIELSASRDLHEVFNEINDEFETAFSYGKQVAFMLEAGKLPYQSRFHVLKGIFSKILDPLAPSSTTSSSRSRVTELAGSYNVYDVPDNRSLNLLSTLEKLYMWEKKLYKEVKMQRG